MNILAELKLRFEPALQKLTDNPAAALEMIRTAQDPKFGDYQANFAMSLGKQLGKSPRDVATQIVAETKLDDLCNPPEIAGPGFINLRLRDDWLIREVTAAAKDDRLGIAPVAAPRTFVVDYSSPNVAKPMHVGHIRSTVIGDALYRILRFLGHRTISDNHLGDWGTQFGMILYGYKHFLDAEAYKTNPVTELGRLYKLVRQLADYRDAIRTIPQLENRIADRESELIRLQGQPKTGDKGADKKTNQAIAHLEKQIKEQREEIESLRKKIAAVDNNPPLMTLAGNHPDIEERVLAETAKLHAGDAENLRLWNEFLPNCRDEIQRVYSRLNVRFDHEYGESFYHDRLAPVVEVLEQKGLAQESQGATCVFLPGFETPMIVRKKDGAFLYATTDIATIQYRIETWQPSAILYVVDHRQSEHFEKLFAAARMMGFSEIELQHIKFGTVLGPDGKPFKTREGSAEGLGSLLDEAVARAMKIVSDNDDAKPSGRELADDLRQQVAEVVGIGALKYADLAANRTSDYEFSYDKMLQMTGNTATYMQYSYARVRSIFRRAGTTAEAVRNSSATIQLTHPAERQLAIQLLRFSEALEEAAASYLPHQLTTYLFDLAKTYSSFFENCPVLRAESDELRASRLLLCDLTARTIGTGLQLLGIQVVEQM
jgi:arginyl-tRNA synthetase